ncbi:hypothetical protein BSKO_07990 [Bryopsis sp. KO-2023]|nr:hypothetical protein BSKO_07990 [Bryopsis sp. KO-2023]
MSEDSENAPKDREGSRSYSAPRVNWKISDFEIVRRLGAGSCSAVAHCIHKVTKMEYAVKMVDKTVIKRNNLTEYVVQERNILDRLDDDGVAKLYFTFQDHCHLYFGQELCTQGELADQILERKNLGFESAVFYAAEVVLILEYFRTVGIIHRDIKPENLVMTEEGHLKIIDFGCAKDLNAKPNEGKRKRRVSFVGTADYVAPEVLENTRVSFATDLWGLGCVVYQMFAGRPPFRGGSEYLTYQNISSREFSYPDDFPGLAKDLVDALLQLQPEARLGCDDLEELKKHEFFSGIEWEKVRSGKAPGFIRRPEHNPEEDDLDWDLKTLANALPVQYDFVPNPKLG